MTPEEIEDWKNQYRTNGYYLRGFFIDTFSKLELAVELYIVVFFFGDPNSEFHFRKVILERLNVENKITAFESLLKKSLGENRKLIEEIITLRNLRNRFAHNLHFIPWKPNKSVITLASQRDQNKLIGYSQKEYDSFIDRLVVAENKITELWRQLLNSKS